jgi:hypothetical protein
VKTPYQKLIKIDILLSYEKLNKKKYGNKSVKAKKTIKNIHAKKSGLNREKPKTDLLKTDRRSVLSVLKTDRFQFRSRFPAGLYSIRLLNI